MLDHGRPNAGSGKELLQLGSLSVCQQHFGGSAATGHDGNSQRPCFLDDVRIHYGRDQITRSGFDCRAGLLNGQDRARADQQALLPRVVPDEIKHSGDGHGEFDDAETGPDRGVHGVSRSLVVGGPQDGGSSCLPELGEEILWMHINVSAREGILSTDAGICRLRKIR